MDVDALEEAYRQMNGLQCQFKTQRLVECEDTNSTEISRLSQRIETVVLSCRTLLRDY